MRAISLNQMSIATATAVELIEAAAEAGFSHVGLRLLAGSPIPLAEDVVGDPAIARAIRDACQASGVRIAEVDHFTIAPDIDFGRYARAMDAAAEIGATHISTTGSDPDPGRTLAGLDRLCAMAAERRLKVGLEFMLYREIKTLQQAAKVVKEVGSPHLGVLIDSLHLSRSGGTPESVRETPPELIAYGQLCDAAANAPPLDRLPDEARGGRLLPGEGSLPLRGFLDAVPKDRLLSLEVPNRDQAHLPPKERALRIAASLKGLSRHLPIVPA